MISESSLVDFGWHHITLKIKNKQTNTQTNKQTKNKQTPKQTKNKHKIMMSVCANILGRLRTPVREAFSYGIWHISL